MLPEFHADRARIYVSFADEDRARAMELVRWLNDSGWRVTADDRHGSAPGQRWSPSPRLEFCDVILCVITPGWLVSEFCHREYSYCAKRGRFVLPVICELSDIGLLPPALRVLPRVDLTQGRMIDYLALKQVLTQAGSQIARAALASKVSGQRGQSKSARAGHSPKVGSSARATSEADRPQRDVLARMLGNRRYFWPALAAVALAAAVIVGLGLWAGL
jgi:TIR domain